MSRAAAARRVSWGFADQALSSLTNFAVGVLVARSATPEAFGAFSVAFATYTIALITSRALASEPFTVRHSATSQADWRAAARGASGLALLVGATAAAMIASAGIAIGGDTGLALLAISPLLPGLLLHDVWRFAFIAGGRADRAFGIDLAWLLLALPGLFLVGRLQTGSLFLPIVAWGGAGATIAVVVLVLLRIRPGRGVALAWFRENRDLGPRYVLEGLVSLGAFQATTYALVVLGGLAAAGSLRGAQLLLGPMQVLLLGATLTTVPEGVRILRRRGPRGLRGPAVAISVAMGVTTLAWSQFVGRIPDELGVMVLGATWANARDLIVPLGLAYAVAGSGLGAGVGLRVLADARRSLGARTVDATAQGLGGIGGAARGAAYGTTIGLLIGAGIGLVTHWVAFETAVRTAAERADAQQPAVNADEPASPGGASSHRTSGM